MEDDFEWTFESNSYDDEHLKDSVLDLIDTEDIKPCHDGKMSIHIKSFKGSDPLDVFFTALIKCNCGEPRFSCVCHTLSGEVKSSKRH